MVLGTYFQERVPGSRWRCYTAGEQDSLDTGSRSPAFPQCCPLSSWALSVLTLGCFLLSVLAVWDPIPRYPASSSHRVQDLGTSFRILDPTKGGQIPKILSAWVLCRAWSSLSCHPLAGTIESIVHELRHVIKLQSEEWKVEVCLWIVSLPAIFFFIYFDVIGSILPVVVFWEQIGKLWLVASAWQLISRTCQRLQLSSEARNCTVIHPLKQVQHNQQSMTCYRKAREGWEVV